ncbi:MAG: vWA domain-containing protein [Chloroflexota bacterium]
MGIEFQYPAAFLLAILLPGLYFYWRWRGGGMSGALKHSSIDSALRAPRTFRQKTLWAPAALRAIALLLIICALARPQSSSKGSGESSEGIDIVIALDLSTSMLAQDFTPNRLEAAKKTGIDFINARANDRIGVVGFAAESYTQCPVTIDHNTVKTLFHGMKSGVLEDGTAIGMGLATAVNGLKASQSKSKVIILLTDGINNTGFVAPETAAEIARTYGIRVYTIGVGTLGKAPYPIETPYGVQISNVDVQIDEGVLQAIADLTGGKYFRATGNRVLEQIYSEIDRLEKSKIDSRVFSRKRDLFPYFLVAALALLGLEIVLGYSFYRKIP